MTTAATTALADLDIQRLLDGEHHEPHRILGPHPGPEGVVVRAFHPDASTAEVAFAGGSVPMVRIAEGLFEAVLPVAELAGYRLRMRNDKGQWEMEDPYRFLPTLGDMDLYLIGEGRHQELWRRLGARELEHQGVPGCAFAVWAPTARAVRLLSDEGHWDSRIHPMRSLGSSGVWELFLPHAREGVRYKFEIVTADGRRIAKADPLARAMEPGHAPACIVERSHHQWQDSDWIGGRNRSDIQQRPLSIYEVHLGSWRSGTDGAVLGYRDVADPLADHCEKEGFTHVELLPIAEHPFGGSWGYQISGYYAPTHRFGSPDDLRWMIDRLHQRGIGVIIDWVPAHFPKDEWALARFDGTALYEHLDPTRGEHPDWGTLIFNFGRNEVRNFLVANARYWVEEFHVDGLRVDAVASMLYLDYSRKAGEWMPNVYGGRENLEAIAFLREVNELLHRDHPGVITVAEESTAWPGVTRPVSSGGLGFDFKWNMGWMHDTLDYLSKDSVFRRYHHHQLTFGLWYAWSERFILPLSHDEVVHLKGSLLGKMPGDRWQQFANLRAGLAWMWAHPGKKLLFMGGELAQEQEWSHERQLDWEALQQPEHAGVSQLVADLGALYKQTPALWETDASPAGFRWIDAGNADQNVISFLRIDAEGRPRLACIANFAPVVHHGYRVGLPLPGEWREVLNTDARAYWGSGQGNLGRVEAEPVPWHGFERSAAMTLPPLAVVWLTPAASAV
ncbi:MAG TPA: 1,4-alpha-glucan branching protein GlgB [Candidatus Sulfotelmatobacter sp.]|nr:1,4-alpha-glucan branching protein GlgB [Candidatus Sulfotelmatobacter sp.]